MEIIISINANKKKCGECKFRKLSVDACNPEDYRCEIFEKWLDVDLRTVQKTGLEFYRCEACLKAEEEYYFMR